MRGRPDLGDHAGMTMEAALSARSLADLAHATADGTRPRYVFFWSQTPRRQGEVDAACLSQWWASRFEADGQSFPTAEHYMMWRKAMLFGDRPRASAILQATSAAQAKALGRQVRGFDQATWVEHRWGIVVDGSVAKFSSDPDLRNFLLSTRNRVLVEASPRDRIWGIGLAADSDRAEVPAAWRGLNLLGFALMEARARLEP